MDSLQIKALIAGISFGVWPLLLNRSGLSGNFSSLVFTGVVLVCVTPFTIGNMGNIVNASWVMAVGAGVVGALGLMSFNGMLAKAMPENASTLFILMLVVQIVVPAIYNIIMNGGLTLTKGFGFLFALAAGILLTL